MKQTSKTLMSAKDLVAKVATRSDLAQKDVKAVLDALGLVVSDQLKHQIDIRLPGLGTLTTQYRAARTQHAFGKTVAIPAKHVPSIRWKQSLKDELASQG